MAELPEPMPAYGCQVMVQSEEEKKLRKQVSDNDKSFIYHQFIILFSSRFGGREENQ